jgi:hypothetical protein
VRATLVSLFLIIVIIVSALSACYRSPADFTYHQPGEYKGSEDSLLAKQQTADQQQVLVERFKLVQTDR